MPPAYTEIPFTSRDADDDHAHDDPLLHAVTRPPSPRGEECKYTRSSPLGDESVSSPCTYTHPSPLGDDEQTEEQSGAAWGTGAVGSNPMPFPPAHALASADSVAPSPKRQRCSQATHAYRQHIAYRHTRLI